MFIGLSADFFLLHYCAVEKGGGRGSGWIVLIWDQQICDKNIFSKPQEFLGLTNNLRPRKCEEKFTITHLKFVLNSLDKMHIFFWKDQSSLIVVVISLHWYKGIISFILQEGDFTAKYNPKWIRQFEDMKENLKSQKEQVCDSRKPASFQHSEDGNNMEN